MTLAEINPLAKLEDGTFVAVDAHMDMENEGRPRQRRSPKPRVGAMWSIDDPIASVLVGGRAVTDRLRRANRRAGSSAAHP